MSPKSEAAMVEFVGDGHLRLPAVLAQTHFRWDHVRIQITPDTLILTASGPEAPDALLLKQRNLAGDRSVMLAEFLGEAPPVGKRPAQWDPRLRRLVISMS